VIVPVYNVQPVYFEQCINSITTAIRSYGPRQVELVVVNDGSDRGLVDHYRSILAASSQGGLSVAFIDRVHNEGMAAARAAGVEASGGCWFLLVDADDLLDSRTFHALDGRIDTDVVLAFTAHQKLTEDLASVIEVRRKTRYFELLRTCAGGMADPFLYHTFLIHLHIIKRSAYRAVGGFDRSIRYGHEIDFHLRLTAKYRLAQNYRYIDHVLYTYRDNPEGVCRSPELYSTLIQNIEAILLSHAVSRGIVASECRRTGKEEDGAVRYKYLPGLAL
jgi:glycosyltransferase involved in cell wall biosynthesis